MNEKEILKELDERINIQNRNIERVIRYQIIKQNLFYLKERSQHIRA